MNKNITFPRNFVPQNTQLKSWQDLEPLLTDLNNRQLNSNADLEKWIFDCSELAAFYSEEESKRYINMTCHTDDPQIEKLYLDFVENIQAPAKPLWNQLNQKYLDSKFRKDLDQKRYFVYDRSAQVESKVFRPANIELQTETTKLAQRYQQICGAMSIEFDGREQTLPQMSKYFESTDRAQRKSAWLAIWQRRLQDAQEVNNIYDQLIKLRDQIARNADCKSYTEYAFLIYRRFDYSPKDCFEFHQAVEKNIVPLARNLVQARAKKMGLTKACPWDIQVDPLGRDALKPFQTSSELINGVQKIFDQLDPELAAQFKSMQENNELDLDSRKGKAPGGYLSFLEESRRPFIFMNAAGLNRDVETLLHESGHAFHALAAQNEPLIEYRSSPLEFAEVASMTMELFGDDYLEVFYTKDEAQRARRKHLEGIIELLPWIAQIDAFQHWIYANPNHSQNERQAYWLDLEKRFGLDLDWTGFEDKQKLAWQKQSHLFTSPFYYIEYGIAQIGALQIWAQYLKDPKSALKNYRNALSLGGSKPLPELFAAAKINFDFSQKTIMPLVEVIEAEVAKL